MNDRVKIIIVLLISLMWGIIIYQNSLGSIIKKVNTNNIHASSIASSRIPAIAVTKNNLVRDSFISQYDNLYSIEIRIGNYERVDNSNLCILLRNVNTNIDLYFKCQNAVNFVNNALYKIDFPTQSDSKNQKFQLQIYSKNATVNDSIALWGFTKTNTQNNKLYINGKLQKNVLDLVQTYKNNYSFSESLDIIYQKLYPKNPYFFKGRYIYLIVLSYPIILFTLVTLFEFLFLYNKSIKNIIITNLIIGILLFSINYYVHSVQNLNIPNITIITPQ
jgi:hypothetical protein